MNDYRDLKYDRKKLREASQKQIGTTGGAALGALAGSFIPSKSAMGMAAGAAAGAVGGGLLGRRYAKPSISDNQLDAGVRKALIRDDKKVIADLKENYGLKLKKQAALENYYFIKESNLKAMFSGLGGKAKAMFSGLGGKAGSRNLKAQAMQVAPSRQVQQMSAFNPREVQQMKAFNPSDVQQMKAMGNSTQVMTPPQSMRNSTLAMTPPQPMRVPNRQVQQMPALSSY